MNSPEFPPQLPLARKPTPFQPLDRLRQQTGGPRIWVKRDDLTDCALSGNKIRKLEFTLARALDQGCDTLITCGGIQSNHCRATALLGAQLGLKVHLILRNETDDSPEINGNLLLDYLAGAEVSIYPKKTFLQKLPKLVEKWERHYQEKGCKTYSIPVGASDGTGVWGYVDCARELKTDCQNAGIHPGAIVHATGSGGTQAGLTAGAVLFDLNAPVIGMAVCDSATWFENKIRADLQSWHNLYQPPLEVNALQINVNDNYIGPGYAVADEAIFDCIRQVAASEGLILDPVYTGKAFYGLLREIEAGHLRGVNDIVFIHTGGIFGLLAQGNELKYSAISFTN